MADISLEIHHLDVRGGDATAIIVKQHFADYDMDKEKPDETYTELYRVLIDAGAEGSGSGALKFYLNKFLKGPFDLVVATHYHQDHIQGFSQAKIEFKKFLDNAGYKDADGTEFGPKNDIGKGARTKIFDSYVTRTQTAMIKNSDTSKLEKPTRVPIPFIKKDAKQAEFVPVEIELGAGTGIKLIVYCANGVLADGTNLLGGQRTKVISPNDVSLAMLIEWGDFRYFTAGDLSGDEEATSYYDIEKPLVNYLKPTTKAGPLTNKNVTVYKASHHGSEFSNQSHLLDTLKPDTIVVCCNLQKQVPSPVFLKRLGTYFAKNDHAKVVFTNTMKVFKQDDRYKALTTIQDSIAEGNVVFETGDEEEFASNLGIKCAVIRRRVKDGTVIEDKIPEKASCRIGVVDMGYDIVLLERDADDANQVAKTVRFTSYELTSTWDDPKANKKTIVAGFTSQAAAMVRWIKNDEDVRETTGRDYLSEHYPGLLKISDQSSDDTRQQALVNKMTEMFDASFRLVKMGGDPFWMRTKAVDNKLTSDEKKTIFNLLWENSYQVKWNQAIKRSGRYRLFEAERGWNAPAGVAPEPDSTAGPKRVRSGKKPVQRAKKRVRK